MSDFNSLYGEDEATDYGADGIPVDAEEVGTIQENITQEMGDAVLSNQGDALGAETQDVPEPLAPLDVTGSNVLGAAGAVPFVVLFILLTCVALSNVIILGVVTFNASIGTPSLDNFGKYKSLFT